jgi:hypothetical protein
VLTLITIAFVVLTIVALIRYASKKSPHDLKPSGTIELTRQLSRVRYMSGTQFEMLVANILRRLGYQTTVLGGSGDQGVDVIARAGNEKIAIQCKNYAKPVGNRPVQEVYAGARHHGCTAAWVVAPEGFTKGALALARSVGVLLHDAQSLQVWIRQIGRRERHLANAGSRTVDLDTLEPRTIDLDEGEATMESGMEKQTVYVGSLDEGTTVGETVSFTANLLGTAHVNGGKEGGGMDYTFYRLRDGNFRVLVETEGIAMLVPSDMDEAISRGQRNNFNYGRMTLEEMKAHSYDFGPVYEQLMENHPDTVRNRVRDID